MGLGLGLGLGWGHRRGDHGEGDRVVREEGAHAGREDAPSHGAAQPRGDAEREEGEVGCQQRLAKLRGPAAEAAEDASHAVDDVNGADLVFVFGSGLGRGLGLGLGLALGLDVGGACKACEDLMREGRDAPDVPRELEARTHAHE